MAIKYVHQLYKMKNKKTPNHSFQINSLFFFFFFNQTPATDCIVSLKL